jgi:hypothetical protein
MVGAALAGTTVRGTIRNALGKPFPHAQVTAIPDVEPTGNGVAGDVLNRWTAANEKGEFTLTLSPGRYKIRAKAEAEGYPDPTFALNSDPTARFPQISVGMNSITGLEIELGKRGGIFEGSLFDRLRHTPLVGATVRFRDARNPDAFVEVSSDSTGRFQFTAPSKPITVFATASGHKPMTFHRGEQVILSPGEHRHLEFELDCK